MRILIANHHLEQRGGSELYTVELALALREAGHELGVFTFSVGDVAAPLRREGIPLFTPADAAALEAFAPEVVHAQHAPSLHLLARLELDTAVVFSALGVLPALEAAPPVFDGIALGFAISEETRDALAASPFGAAVPLEIVRNWFDDRDVGAPATAPGAVQRIAVVSNHLDPVLAGDLEALCAERPGTRWQHFGLPDHVTELEASTLRGFDAVVTIGRTALLASALGIPCLLYDRHGCDGLVSGARLDAQASRNFSGRLTRHRPTREELASLLFREAPALDTVALAAEVRTRFALRRRIEELVAHYQRAIGSGIRFSATTRAAYGRLGEVHADLLAELSSLRADQQARREWVAHLEHDIVELRAGVTHLEGALQRERALRVQLELDRSARSETENSLRQTLDVKDHQIRAIELRLTTFERSLTERALRKLGQVRRGLLVSSDRNG